jgi:PAS domain S-box-containing protein
MLHPFIIGLSIVGFMVGEVFAQYAEARVILHSVANRFLFLNAFSKGLLSGVIISFNLENLLFESKKSALELNPSTRLTRTSLYSKVFVIMAAIVLFFVFQIFTTSANFFDLGSDFLEAKDTGTDINRFFDSAFDSPEIRSSMKVIAVKTLFYFVFIFQLILQIKRMIRNPIKAIHDRLALINSGNASGVTEVDILSNDEFTDALKEINTLIRKQQEELSCSSERLEGIVEGAADPIISFDENAKILVFNPAAQVFFGYTADEAQNLTLVSLIEYECTHTQTGDCTAEKELVRALTDESSGLMRFTGLHKSGSRVAFESNVSSARAGTSVIYTAILRDISRQMETESHLTAAKVAAENANRLKTEFLANMSHELRTPLNAVLGFTQLLENDRNLTDAQREKLGIISRSGGHLLSLINDILDISKIEAGKFEIHESVFALPDFVNDIREMFSLRCQKAGLGLYVEFAGDVPARVKGDIGKLRQVLINLVGNAVKFTKEGGIGITVGPDGGKIRFSVTDSGKGIPADELELIMQPFRQSSLTDNEGGTGLGLAISSRYIQMMGGSLSVTSTVGEGSAFTFAIELPETDAEVPGTADEPLAIAVKKGKEVTALIVDDKELNRLVLKEMLETAGFLSIEAENGKIAVERAREFHPDLVFMDIKMPVMDGYEAVRVLKADPATAGIPVFALTASAFTNDEAKILQSGFDGFLAKPFKKSSLFALIRDKSHIDLEYETSIAPRSGQLPDPDSIDWKTAAQALGKDGIAELSDRTLINDFTAIQSIAARIDVRLPELATLMAHYAGNYDETALEGMVKRLIETDTSGGNA